MSTYNGSIHENHDQAINEVAERTTYGNYIDGQITTAETDQTFQPEDPAVGRPITEVPQSGAADVDDAVTAASKAYEHKWGNLTAMERGDMLRSWAETLRDNIDELALLATLEVGKPLSAAKSDAETGIRFIEYYASVAAGEEGRVPDVDDDGLAYVRQEPYGATGQILPWNYPVLLLGWKVGAALAAGNTSVTKPPEQAPLSITRAAQLSEDFLPDGVLNIVNGIGDEAGEAITAHSGLDKLSFTGSLPVGQKVMHAAADNITPVTLELGGKNPLIVFPEADIESAAETAVNAGLYNNGQSCDSGSRLLVHDNIKEEFMDVYVDALMNRVIGDPLQDPDQGPVCYREHIEKIEDYVEIGKQEGASVLSGGGRLHDELDSGYFFEPTVFVDVDPEMRIAQEEIFGPVQFVMTFGSYDEAIEIANGTDYGLAAGVFSENLSRAHRAAADLEAGSIWVNQYFGTVPGTPFGGFKQSGIGRECGKDAINEFTQTKSIHISLNSAGE